MGTSFPPQRIGVHQTGSTPQLLQDLRREEPDAAVIVLCGGVLKRRGTVIGFMDVEEVRRASLELGAYAVLEKPVQVEELLLTAERAPASRPTRGDRRQDNTDEPRRPTVLIVTVDYPASLRDLVDREAATDSTDQAP